MHRLFELAQIALAPMPAYATPQYALKHIDLHLHCRLERQVPLGEWIDLAVRDGRKVIVALNRRELYDMTPAERAEWAKTSGYAFT